ncbi:endonuclease domain-containing protein [Hyphomonas sp.]|uniref:endonuclease domain-containing protein n=1 Tax=Hyphomonas sp. TaxID=87 RepID=UPI0025BA1725|nr:DUF559 domain-containing protein [Hyphomonas sp.]
MPNPRKIHRARELRRHMPPAEKAVWWHLRSPLFKLWHFRRQAPCCPWFADFISHRMNLVLEIDGDTHTPGQDAARDAWFAARGYETLRIPNSDVYDNIDGVMETILARLRYIEQTRLLPDAAPPHKWGGGQIVQLESIPIPMHNTSPPPDMGEGQGGGALRMARLTKIQLPRYRET